MSSRWGLGLGLVLGLVLMACGRTVESCVADCIPIPSGDISLAAQLELPPGPGPHPILVVVHGSGKVERGQFTCETSPWLERGVGLLCYDKRGVGQSTGSYSNVGTGSSVEVFPILAGDVVAVVEYVAGRPEIDADRIGLIGGSQAGWLMPLAASLSDEIDFIISISGATSSVGISDRFDAIAERGLSEEEIEADLASYEGTLGFDPRPVLEELDIPVLWLYGGRDQSNPTANDISIIEEIVAEHGSDFTIEFFPTANHALVDVETGTPIDALAPMFPWLNRIGVIGTG